MRAAARCRGRPWFRSPGRARSGTMFVFPAFVGLFSHGGRAIPKCHLRRSKFDANVMDIRVHPSIRWIVMPPNSVPTAPSVSHGGTLPGLLRTLNQRPGTFVPEGRRSCEEASMGVAVVAVLLAAYDNDRWRSTGRRDVQRTGDGWASKIAGQRRSWRPGARQSGRRSTAAWRASSTPPTRRRGRKRG